MWVESHQSLGNHPKTILLSIKLGISKAQVIGHLHLLWWWCADYAPDGVLNKYQPEQIADAADWAGNAGEFLQHVADCGFIDRDPLRVHDWQSYRLHFDNLQTKRERNLNQIRRRVNRWRKRNAPVTQPAITMRSASETELESSRPAPKPNPQKSISHLRYTPNTTDQKRDPILRRETDTESCNAVCNAPVTQKTRPTIKTLKTLPDLTKTLSPLPPGAFQIIWAKYPRRLGQKAALRHFTASVKTPQDWLDIQNALDNFTLKMRVEGRADEFIQHGSTWFNNWRDWVNYKGVSLKALLPVPKPRPPDPDESELPTLEDIQNAKLQAGLK